MMVVIDRFEGDFAVCEKEDRTMFNIKRNKLPNNAKEGDVLIIQGDLITINITETARRKKFAQELADNISQNND
jgi:hypothetical protein